MSKNQNRKVGSPYKSTGGGHCVVTVHGIRTYGDWQARLKAILLDAVPDINVRSYVYGYFSVIAFMFPPSRWLLTRRFRRELIRVCKEHPTARIDLVGHSFGTHLLAWAIRGIPKANRPKIHTIILAASVLRADFPWNELIAEGTVRRIVNDCGIDDAVLILNQLSVLFTGMAGRVGFAGMTSPSFQNRFFSGGHSLYFYKDKMASNDFMNTYWMPLLLEENSFIGKDERLPPSIRDGIVHTMVKNAEPIKLVIYAILLLTPTFYIYSLYTDAEAQRKIAAEKTRVANKANVELFETVQWLVKEFVPSPVDGSGNTTVGSWNEETIKMLHELISRADKFQISNAIWIMAYVGRFCRDKNGVILEGEKPLSVCATLGNTDKHDITLANKMGNELKTRLLEDIQTPRNVQIEVYLSGIGPDKYKYPPEETSTINVWNRIASLNTRVEVEIRPTQPLMDLMGYPTPPQNVTVK